MVDSVIQSITERIEKKLTSLIAEAGYRGEDARSRLNELMHDIDRLTYARTKKTRVLLSQESSD